MFIPLLLAPMAELSHRGLRELIEIFGGCDEYFTEMISATALLSGGMFEKWYIDPLPYPKKLVYQLLGSDIDVLAKAVNLLDKYDCAGIDINMGCSAPLITKCGAGVKLMADIHKSGELIRELRRQTQKRLSVKLRIGFEDNFEYLVNFCKRLENEGVDCITLHPRTAKEKFKRSPRWEYVGFLRSNLTIPVIGNGDISSAEEILSRSKENCDGIMVGRLGVRAPWIFCKTRQMEKNEKWDSSSINLEEIALIFLDLLSKYQPQEFHLSRARLFFAYFCDNFTWGTYLKTLINRETSISAIANVLKAYFKEHPEERKEKSIRQN